MIIWLNGAFGSGKTTTAYGLHHRIPNSFIYDPERIGYFIRKNIPKHKIKHDFQDHQAWREMNYSLLKEIAASNDQVIIVPMTIVNEQYFEELIGRLSDEGMEVRHFTLMANRNTLLSRLRSRGDLEHSWPAQQIDRCMVSLSSERFAEHIITDHLSSDELVQQIAAACQIQLVDDHRSFAKKKLDQMLRRFLRK